MPADPHLQLRLYGGFVAAWSDGADVTVAGAKHRALLAMLATAANGTHSRAWLQEHLWSLSGEEHGRASLRRALSDLRRIMGERFDLLFDVSNIELRMRPERVRILGNPAQGLFLDGLVVREPQFQEWLDERRRGGTFDARGTLDPGEDVTPRLAVIPFLPVAGGPEALHLGDLLSLEITRAITRSKMIDVISHLSCRRFSGRELRLEDVRGSLAIDYMVSGTVRLDGSRFRLDADFVEARTGRVLWTRDYSGDLKEVMAGESDTLRNIAREAGRTVLRASVELARSKPLPEVESHALYMSAIAQMHEHHLGSFSQARKHLELLIERIPNRSMLHAHLAKWYTLAISQGWSDDPNRDIGIARDITSRALDLDPMCALSLTIDGMVQSSSAGDYGVANARFTEAVQINPNQAMAWLLFSRMHAFLGQGREAVHYANKACSLSPLDPHSYFYDAIRAMAHLANEDYEAASKVAKRSIEANPRHSSSYRALAVAQELNDDHPSAAQTVSKLMRLEPDFTIRKYLGGHPAGRMGQGRLWAKTLARAGVPES